VRFSTKKKKGKNQNITTGVAKKGKKTGVIDPAMDEQREFSHERKKRQQPRHPSRRGSRSCPDRERERKAKRKKKTATWADWGGGEPFKPSQGSVGKGT